MLLTALTVCGCASEVGVRNADAAERLSYNWEQHNSVNPLSPTTVNVLGNHLLTDSLDKNPLSVLYGLEDLFAAEPREEYIIALSESALYAAHRQQEPDAAVKYYLSAAIYSYGYLGVIDKRSDLYSPDRIRLMRVYNSAVAGIMDYLKHSNLLTRHGFELTAAAGQKFFFRKPQFMLPVEQAAVSDIINCADFRTENLTHSSRRFGVGVPLIIGIDSEKSSLQFARNQSIPATMIINFRRVETDGELQRFDCQVQFIDPRRHRMVKLGRNMIPSECDLSTPLAYMMRQMTFYNHFIYTMRPDATREVQGLYSLEPDDDMRIPIVLVHGLLSDTRTWAQLINSLQSDPDISRYYRFMGFSYSSGNPVLYSGFLLRQALLDERQRLIKAGKSVAMFDRMVVVGHSMGGLLARQLVSDSGDVLIEKTVGMENYNKMLSEFSPEEVAQMEKMARFKPLDFIRRVIFIAVPHRGSVMADTWYGRLGASMIKLPQKIIDRNRKMLRYLAARGRLLNLKSLRFTGVDNLAPDNLVMQLLNTLSFSPDIPCHSIIGNLEGAGIPGGSDGVVAYSSSHLDFARSEKVVQSGHAAQKNPLAIQELRRILLEHLRQYPDIKLTEPLLVPGLRSHLKK